jgi:hypothetical protein
MIIVVRFIYLHYILFHHSTYSTLFNESVMQQVLNLSVSFLFP